MIHIPARFPLFGTIFCALGVCILFSLCIWQVQRLAWKEDLQKQLDAAYAKGVTLPVFSEDNFRDDNRHHIVRGHISLTLDPSKAVIMHGRVNDGHATLAMVVPASSPQLLKSVMVEVGCFDKAPSYQKNKLPKVVNAVGVVRLPQWSYFMPSNVPAKGDWWRLDARDFQEYFRTPFYDRVLTLETVPPIFTDAAPCPVEHQLRNDHKAYAIFWAVMGCVLCLMWYIRFYRPYLQSA